MNNEYCLRVGAPLLRAGLTIETTVSERYVVAATEKLLDLVRAINDAAEPKCTPLPPHIQDIAVKNVKEAQAEAARYDDKLSRLTDEFNRANGDPTDRQLVDAIGTQFVPVHPAPSDDPMDYPPF